jgi:hypothetical protein
MPFNPSDFFNDPEFQKHTKQKTYFKGDHRCHGLPCGCPVWNLQRRAVRECLFVLPVSRKDYQNKTWLNDPEFWQVHSNLDPDNARNQMGIERLAARICEINDIFEESKLPFYIDRIAIPDTHGKKRYFLVTGLNDSELKHLRRKL